jgi:Xaa-Pro aminopeptidase
LRPALATHFPSAEVIDLTPVLDELRLIKSPSELAALREAGRITGVAVIEAMRSTQAGVFEYELGAVADFVFGQAGARGGSYEAIVATGTNAWHGHYVRKDTVLTEGELVLMDYAPDLNYYTSDIGRMWPVSGRWEPWQLELYGFILRYHRALLSRIRPGVTTDAVLADARAEMSEVFDATRWSAPEFEAAARGALDFRGHLSHPVGMAVHDVGSYRDRPFEEGLVFSVDPMLWVPERNLYVRCEDTVALTADGIENFTGFVPLDPEEIEAAMAEPGLLQVWRDR